MTQPNIQTKNQSPTLLQYAIAGGASLAMTTGLYFAAKIGTSTEQTRSTEFTDFVNPTTVHGASIITAGILSALGAPARYAIGIPLLGPVALAAYNTFAYSAKDKPLGDILGGAVLASLGVLAVSGIGYLINGIRKESQEKPPRVLRTLAKKVANVEYRRDSVGGQVELMRQQRDLEKSLEDLAKEHEALVGSRVSRWTRWRRGY